MSTRYFNATLTVVIILHKIQEDLLPVLEYFLRDVEEVRVGVISR